MSARPVLPLTEIPTSGPASHFNYVLDSHNSQASATSQPAVAASLAFLILFVIIRITLIDHHHVNIII